MKIKVADDFDIINEVLCNYTGKIKITGEDGDKTGEFFCFSESKSKEEYLIFTTDTGMGKYKYTQIDSIELLGVGEVIPIQKP